MKFFAILLAVLMFPSLAFARSDAHIIAEAKGKYPGYSSYKLLSSQTDWEDGSKYRTYFVQVEKKGGLACYPQATLEKRIWVSFWVGGGLKSVFMGDWGRLNNMPEPKAAAVKQALKKADFDPKSAFMSSTLWNILELDKTLTYHEEYPLVHWVNEKEVDVNTTLRVKELSGCCSVVDRTIAKRVRLKSEDCGESFEVEKVGAFSANGPRFSKEITETFSKEKVTNKQAEALRKSSIGFKLAEEKAREEWEALPEVEIPEFEDAYAYIMHLRDLMLTAEREEIRSFIMRTMLKGYFVEGSEYILTGEAQSRIDAVLNAVFPAPMETGFRDAYCSTIVNAEPGDNWYTFQSNDRSRTTKITVAEEDGKFKFYKTKIQIPPDASAEELDCPEPVYLVDVEDEALNLTAKMPSGFETKETSRGKTMSRFVNGAEYVIMINDFSDKIGPEYPTSAMYDTVKGYRKSFMSKFATYDEELTDWEYKGVKGVEARFLGKGRGTSYPRDFKEKVWYRGIMFGDKTYELIIAGDDRTPVTYDFMEAFESDNYSAEAADAGAAARGAQAEAEERGFEVEDRVLMETARGRWDKCYIEAEMADNRYQVRCYEADKRYPRLANDKRYKKVPVKRLKPDPNPTQ